MDLVTQFHDTLFDEAGNKTKFNSSPDGNYSPKSCPAEWFNEEGKDDSIENASRLKFRADRLYIKGKYEEAILNYSNVIPLLEPSNVTIRRDSLEGMIRSAVKLKDYTRADIGIDQLMQMAKSSTQLCSVWKLKAEMYFLNGNFKDEIDAWKFVLKHHPVCYEYWLNLGTAYVNSLGSNININANMSSINYYNIILRIVSCFIRSRLLIDTIENNPRHFNFQTKQEIKKQINAKIQSFSLPTPFLSTADDHMSRDIRKEDDEKPQFDDISSRENQEFDVIWFSWLDHFHKQ